MPILGVGRDKPKDLFELVLCSKYICPLFGKENGMGLVLGEMY